MTVLVSFQPAPFQRRHQCGQLLGYIVSDARCLADDIAPESS